MPPDKLEETVDQIAEIPHHGLLQNKEVLNTNLEIMGVGAVFRNVAPPLVIAGAGHFLQEDAGEQAAAGIRDWMAAKAGP